MRLSPEMVKLVVERRKTQIRIPAIGACPYVVGRRYSIIRGPRVTIFEAREEPLEAISQQDVRREGFRFPAEFFVAWGRLYGVWSVEHTVWVVTFAVGDMRNRFDVPRLLKATPGHAGDEVEPSQDYTSRSALAMADEPEAISARELEAYARDAQQRDELRCRQRVGEPSLVSQVRDLQRAALEGDRRAQRDLFVIGQRVDKAQKRRSRAA